MIIARKEGSLDELKELAMRLTEIFPSHQIIVVQNDGDKVTVVKKGDEWEIVEEGGEAGREAAKA